MHITDTFYTQYGIWHTIYNIYTVQYMLYLPQKKPNNLRASGFDEKYSMYLWEKQYVALPSNL